MSLSDAPSPPLLLLPRLFILLFLPHPPLLAVRLKPWKWRDNPNPVWWIIWKTQRAGSALRVGSMYSFFFFFFFSGGRASENIKNKNPVVRGEKQKGLVSHPEAPLNQAVSMLKLLYVLQLLRRRQFFFFFFCSKIFAVLHQGHRGKQVRSVLLCKIPSHRTIWGQPRPKLIWLVIAKSFSSPSG